MLRRNNRSLIREALQAHPREVVDKYTLTNEQRKQIKALKAEKRALKKDALKYREKAEKTVNTAKNSIAVAVGAFLCVDWAYESLEPSEDFGNMCLILIILVAFIYVVTALQKLSTIRAALRDIHESQWELAQEADDMLYEMESDGRGEVVDTKLRLRMEYLKQETIPRVGKQVWLHLLLGFYFFLGVGISAFVIHATYKNAIRSKKLASKGHW